MIVPNFVTFDSFARQSQLLLGVLLFAGCASTFHQRGFDLLLSQPLTHAQRISVVKAREDFEAVLRYQKPIHALPDPYEISDGGSWSYSGQGYTITVLRQFAGVEGGDLIFLYGPKLKFDQGLFPRFHHVISNTTYYKAADIWQKLKLPLPVEEER